MSTPPATPPSKSRWGRMGGVVRRASTLMAISRPGTPSERDSDTASLRRSTSRELIPPAVPALSPPPPPKGAEASFPSPIAESPAGEAEAAKQEAIGPSPLALPPPEAQAPTPAPATSQEVEPTTSPEPLQPAAPAPTSGEQGEQAASPTGYIPPPVIDSLAGNPGAFTDEPESLPQPDVVADPYSASSPPPAEASVQNQAPASTQGEVQGPPTAVVDSAAGNPGAFSDLSDDLPKPAAVVEDPFNSVPNPVSEPPPPAEEEPAPESKPAVAQEDVPPPAPEAAEPESYFDRPIVESVVDLEAVSPEVQAEPAPAPAQPEETQAPAQPQVQPAPAEGEAASYMRGDVSMPIPETHMNDARPVEAPSSSEPQGPAPETQAQSQTGSLFGAAVMPSYGHDMDMSMGLPSYSGHDIWGGAISTNTGAANTATAAEYKQKTENGDSNAHNANNNTSTVDASQEHGDHNIWATGTVVASAAAAAAVAAIGGMAYVASQNKSQSENRPEEEQKANAGTSAASMPMPVPHLTEGDAGANLSRDSSIRMPLPNPHPEPSENTHEPEAAPYPDPFADPVEPVPNIDVHNADESQSGLQMPEPVHEEVQPIVVPLPPFREVIPSGSVHRVPSHTSNYSAGNGNGNPVTDERIPLLIRPATPSKHQRHNPYTGQPPAGQERSSISPLLASGSASAWNPNSHSSSHHHQSHHGHIHDAHQLRLHELGWLEYHLPDGTVYYVHPTRKVTTDANLRKDVVLDALEAWLDERSGYDGEDRASARVGVEGWVKEILPRKGGRRVAKGKNGEELVFFERYWVDHIARTVVKEDANVERRVGGYGRGNGYSYQHGYTNASGKGKRLTAGSVATGSGRRANEEDQLDLEYRFWSFMEAYPAHSALPAKARAEAMDVLTWAWTDRLLPSNRAIPAPFSQEECQELMSLLRSFNENRQDDYGIQTRVIARILLRVALWRQTYFRPNKLLPKDVGTGPYNRLPSRRRPLSRVFFDFFISIICLGIPYLFLERARLAGRTDVESGLLRSTSPMVVIGTCTCLVAAIVLSASVTFLSLPGLDSVARTAGMVAILFAAFTMVATGVAVLRHKTDLERRVPPIGVEGLMIVSRRTVALSLPLVFLAYSIIAFVTAIVLYTYRGTNPSSPKHPFEDYMRWTVVGVVGGLVGIVTTSLLLLRR